MIAKLFMSLLQQLHSLKVFLISLQVLAKLAYQYYFKDDLQMSPSQVSLILGKNQIQDKIYFILISSININNNINDDNKYNLYFEGIIYIPWCIKPLFAFHCDTYRLFGYRRKSYLILWALIESILWLILGSSYCDSAYKTVFILFWLKVSVCYGNVIGEALVVEIAKIQQKFNKQAELTVSQKIKEKNEESSGTVSLFMSLKMIGIIISSYYGALLLEHLPKKQSKLQININKLIIYILLILVFQLTAFIPMILFFFAFFLPETKKPAKKNQEQNLQQEKVIDEEQQPLQGDQQQKQEVNQEIKYVEETEDQTKDNFKKFINFIKQKEILYPVLFLFLFSAAPSSEGVMFFFFTNELHFSALFMGQIKVISTLGNLIAIYIFHKYLRDIKFKTIFFWSAILAVIVYESQIILLERWNKQLGIPDKIFALFDSFIIHLLKEINLLPILVLGCKMCPKNIEATMYAFITTVLNFGNLISLYSESLIAYHLQISSYNFENLTQLVIICGLSHLLIALFVYQINFCEDISEEQLEKIASCTFNNQQPSPQQDQQNQLHNSQQSQKQINQQNNDENFQDQQQPIQESNEQINKQLKLQE